jgi:hypothetical protein
MAAFLMIFDHALAEWLDLGAFRPISRHPSERDLCLLGAGYLRQKVLLLRSLSKSAATAMPATITIANAAAQIMLVFLCIILSSIKNPKIVSFTISAPQFACRSSFMR